MTVGDQNGSDRIERVIDMLTGVSPETAKSLSEHGLSEDVISKGTLKTGLKMALESR